LSGQGKTVNWKTYVQILPVLCNTLLDLLLEIHNFFWKTRKTLKDIFCRSRPFDKPNCVLGNPRNCKICPAINNGSCATKHVVYLANCKICTESLQLYDGETNRSSYHRFMEHQRAAAHPSSYQHDALAFSRALFNTPPGYSAETNIYHPHQCV
jgi:hypothetical protein